MKDSNRIYSEKVDVNHSDIQEFYNKRARMFMNGEKNGYTTVLLGDSNPDYAKKWDGFEKEYIMKYLNIQKDKKVLDIGCGIGRWAESIIPLCGEYIGIDFSSEMINAAKERFKNAENAHFVNASFQQAFEISEIKNNKFDIIIIAGVSMYINDNDLKNCFHDLSGLMNPGAVLYIEESVGVERRLTLNHIWSESLEDNYDAIYRTREEYLEMLTDFLDSSEVIQEAFFEELDKKDLSETSHWYGLFKKKIQ